MKLGYIIGAVFLTSCATELAVKPDPAPTKALDRPISGVAYALPMAQFDIKLTWRIEKCPDVTVDTSILTDESGDPVEDGSGNQIQQETFTVADGGFKIAQNAEAKLRYTAGETYVIDPAALAARSKTSSVELEFYEDTRTLKSINASADDKTGDIIQSGVSTLLSLASIATGVPVSATQESTAEAGAAEKFTSPPVQGCNQATVKALAGLNGSAATLKAATQAVEDAAKKVQAFRTDHAFEIQFGLLTDADKDELRGLRRTLDQNKQALLAANKAHQAHLKQVAFSKTIVWPKRHTDRASGRSSDFRLSRLEARQAAEKWFKPAPADAAAPNPRINPDVLKLIQAEMETKLRRDFRFSALLKGEQPRQTEAPQDAYVGADDSGAYPGFLYRLPSSGKLVVCKRRGARPCSPTSGAAILQSPTPLTIPQLGQLRIIPFDNGAFQNNELSVSLRKDGSLESFTYKEAESSAANAASAVSSSVESVAGYLLAVDAAREKEREDAEAKAKAEAEEALSKIKAEQDAKIAELNFEIQTLELERKRAELEAAGDVSRMQSLQDQTAELNARIALLTASREEIEAQQALTAAQAAAAQ